MTNSLRIRPIAGALGAEIGGVDLARELDGNTIAAIRRAWLDHLVVFFRGQPLTPERFLAFARLFGEAVEYPFIKGVDGFPEITPVVKLERERVNFGGLWHSDIAYLERPPMGTMLIARELPPYRGDTLFANMYRAYESLSPGMQRLLDGFVAVNSSVKATSRRPAKTVFATVLAPMRSAKTRLGIPWFAPIPRPGGKRSTSMAPIRCASRT